MLEELQTRARTSRDRAVGRSASGAAVGSGGGGNSINRQPLLLVVGALGFRLHSSQLDTDFRG
jgi:hypothetical protein